MLVQGTVWHRGNAGSWMTPIAGTPIYLGDSYAARCTIDIGTRDPLGMEGVVRDQDMFMWGFGVANTATTNVRLYVSTSGLAPNTIATQATFLGEYNITGNGNGDMVSTWVDTLGYVQAFYNVVKNAKIYYMFLMWNSSASRGVITHSNPFMIMTSITQAAVRYKVNGEWRRISETSNQNSRFKVSGEYKKHWIYIKVNGQWRLGI